MLPSVTFLTESLSILRQETEFFWPDMENLLEEYPAPLEQTSLETYNWENSRDQLRSVYVLDPMTGKPVMDGNQPQTRGSDEQKLLDGLFESAKDQQKRLNDTRTQLAATSSAS